MKNINLKGATVYYTGCSYEDDKARDVFTVRLEDGRRFYIRVLEDQISKYIGCVTIERCDGNGFLIPDRENTALVYAADTKASVKRAFEYFEVAEVHYYPF